MAPKNLQQILDTAGDIVGFLRNSRAGPYYYPVVTPEFRNWYVEQRAWRNSVVLMDQSHHMDSVFIRGRDAFRLVSETAVTSVNSR